MKGNRTQVKKKFELSYELACRWWQREDLEPKPANIERVAEVLRQAEIEVYKVKPVGSLVCEPRPRGVWEALSGRLWIPSEEMQEDFDSAEAGVAVADADTFTVVRTHIYTKEYILK